MNDTFTLDDFLKSIESLERMARWERCFKMIPGMGKLVDAIQAVKEMRQVKAVIQSMTRAERVAPEGIDDSRRTRIANGSGSDPTAVDSLLKQFRWMQEAFRRMREDSEKKRRKPRRPKEPPGRDEDEPRLEW